MWNLVKKIWKTQIKNPKWVAFVAIFPIILIVFIGYVLSSTFGEKSSLPDVDVVVLDNSAGEVEEVIDAISGATVSVAKDYGLKLSRIESEEDGLREARVNKKVYVKADDKKISIYYNSSDSINGSRVNGVFQGVANSVQVVEQIHDINDEMADQILAENNAEFELPMHIFKDTSFMSSYDYYGIAEITLMILYIAMIPLLGVFKDRATQIKSRMKIAGISEVKYYGSSLIAYTVVGAVAMIPSFLVSIIGYNVKWGKYPVLMYLLLILFACFCSMFGIMLATILKNRGKVDVIMAVILIPIVSFLGGSFSPFSFNLDSVLNKITLISPLRWVNLAIFNTVYNDNNLMMCVTVGLLIVLTAFMFVLTVKKASKEE